MSTAQHSVLRLRLFAKYREALGFEERLLTVPADITRVHQLLDWLATEQPEWLEVLTASDKLIALNQEIVGLDAEFKAGDELALLPPVTGG